MFYINDYGQEIKPDPNTEMLHHLRHKHVLVYSCGSLWTSIVPCLALKGVATSIARSKRLKAKVLFRESSCQLFTGIALVGLQHYVCVPVNARNDRETMGYTASDYVSAIVRSLNDSNAAKKQGKHGSTNNSHHLVYPQTALVTHLVYLESGRVPVDADALQASRVLHPPLFCFSQAV